nr:MAG TPA: hypothetical protein [Caudoviricetes sp.]
MRYLQTYIGTKHTITQQRVSKYKKEKENNYGK